MVYEWVAEAAEAKRCGYELSARQLSRIGSGVAF
jgi:hypothetical protein